MSVAGGRPNGGIGKDVDVQVRDPLAPLPQIEAVTDEGGPGVAGELPGHADQDPEVVVATYRQRIAEDFDRVIAGAGTEGEPTHG